MAKNEIYNQLLEKVQQAGGYVKFDVRPLLITNDGKQISAAAIFESTDDSSPLKVINDKFNVLDIDDYNTTNDISWLLTYVMLNKK